MAWFFFWQAMLISYPVDLVQPARGGVRWTTICSHCEQLPTQLKDRDGHDVVRALPIFGRHMLGDDAFNGSPVNEGTAQLVLKLDQQQELVFVLCYAGTPDDRVRERLEGYRADLEALLVESLGSERAKVVGKAFVGAVMGREHELEVAAGANAPMASQ